MKMMMTSASAAAFFAAAATPALAWTPSSFHSLPLPDPAYPYEHLKPAELSAMNLPPLTGEPLGAFLRALRSPNAHQVEPMPPNTLRGVGVLPAAKVSHVGATAYQSLNWSGTFYTTTHGSLTVIPTYQTTITSISPHNGDPNEEILATWVGMGGFNPGDDPLHQAGNLQSTTGSCLGGNQSVAFYECFPAGAIGLFVTNPGDTIYTSIWFDGIQGDVFAVDYNNGNVVFGSTGCNVPHAQTVEAIAEAASVNGNITIMPNYGSMTYTNANGGQSGGNQFGSSSANTITLVQNGTVASVPIPEGGSTLGFQSYP